MGSSINQRWLGITCLVLFTGLKHVSSVPMHENIIAHPGEDVTLTCVGPMNVLIKAVEWYIKGYYKSFVFSWRGGDQPDVENQLEAFKGRVPLTDPQMKDNNVSVTIKNVTRNDSLTYECHISNGTMDHTNSDTPFGTNHTKIITLIVVDKSITAHPGNNVTLTFDVPMNVSLDTVQLSKDNLKDPICSCVRDEQPDTEQQDSSVKEETWQVIVYVVIGVICGIGVIVVIVVKKRKGRAEQSSNQPPDEKLNEVLCKASYTNQNGGDVKLLPASAPDEAFDLNAD